MKRYFLAFAALVALSLRVGAQPVSERYIWRNVTIGGGGFVTGIIFHPHERNLMYARTDIGGAYRWDAQTLRWIPLTDWIGRADANLTGIESVAVDPADANRVYLAAGTYGSGPAAILRSNDRGNTFERTDAPFRMGANEPGRGNGERLAVDPNDGKILFFGSRHDGLWRSEDRGVSWKKVESFPDPSANPASSPDVRPQPFGYVQQAVGVVCVLFDSDGRKAGERTPLVYAAVSRVQTNFFRSADAGLSWQAVANQPVGLCPNHIVRAANGIIYLSYGKEPGPNTMTDGAVWKFNPQSGAWTDITPVQPKEASQPFGYGAVAVDAQHSETLVATTFCHWKPHDEVFRSTNGGKTWMALLDNAEWDYSNASYTRARAPHWMGDIEINPFDSNQVLFTTGYGIWSCVKASAADSGRPTRWVFLDNGLEETVPLALISPPEGAHLLSGVGDIDGFRHDDLTASPAETLPGPLFANTEDFAFAGSNPRVMARTGTLRERREEARAAYSLDGGKSWRAFATEPPNSAGAGNIAVSADGRAFVWTPRRGVPCVTTNFGTSWSVCAGLAAGTRVVADAVNPFRFYALHSGKVLASTNGATAFFVAALAETNAPSPLMPRSGAVLYSTPGCEADLWLASRSTGLYHSADGGVNFTKIGPAQEAQSLGFGKTREVPGYPALFLAGKFAGVEGIFRSDDAATTWIRINDDAHQFGWIDHVTGDPRIFGRVYFATGGRGIIYGDPAQTK